eukprot:TRINITY_DN24887_c0_g1_i1.p1 TRINITY_DN24887_c0_g1~~TRINITY_DN24887_c0_g1_i1.p1  ORF type:complete len:538 (+),score=97.17 TRINITY_DN24887_c0_g1_i1:63-1676(+)
MVQTSPAPLLGQHLDCPLLDRKLSRQFSEPIETVSMLSPTGIKRRQSSEPVKGTGLTADLDPRVVELCRLIGEGSAHVELPFGPVIAVAPRSRTLDELEDDFAPPMAGRAFSLEKVPEEDCQQKTITEPTPVKVLLSPQDEWPVLIVCCFMSLAQGCSMCACFGVISYFSKQMESPSLLLYTTIVQTLLTPIVLDAQRRYDHVFDYKFGHHNTFLFRIAGLSVVQVALLIAMAFATTPAIFLLVAGLSGTVTVMVFAKVCMVISCIEGAQGVNFARTACHSGGMIVMFLVSMLGISSQSEFRSVLIFFVWVAALQFLALLVWYLEHFKNKSLSSAYAVIASQQSYIAGMAEGRAKQAMTGQQEGESGFTLASMFGKDRLASGVVLLCSFSTVWMSWTFITSVLNEFGDEDLTQWLKLLTFPADTGGRLLSHVIHGCLPEHAERVPTCLFHGLTAVALMITGVLIFDTFVHFLRPSILGAVIFGLCFIVTFDLNELSVKVMQVASSRTQVAHLQNFIFFSSTGAATLLALLFELLHGC